MFAWFRNLGQREQLMLACGGLFLCFAAAYVAIAEPLQLREKRALARFQTHADTLAMLQSQQARVATLADTEDTRVELPEGQTMFTIINRTAKEAAIAASIKRINPQGKLAATVVAKDVEFNKFARWLVDIYQAYGIEVTEFSVNASSDAGLVNATFELTVAQ